ncbi:ribosome silencing factor [[Clostridium] aminophilum]|uniref:Ribosomal silencing factor RsfS n=2 Tax=[Clostridium] aminophilum TaxID=1526 RepID=A0A1I0EGR8_9FIRM|nr:ribosome silencing factor [[Clostridium] aminophilum]SET44367.1 ribosome-associated protein [[Clostridium] aminophilum]
MAEMTTKEYVKIAVDALEDKKANDIRIIDIHEISVIADYFIICDGASASQVHALADNLEEKLAKAGKGVHKTEGYGQGTWILEDYGDIIVHIFQTEEREFYDLERMWMDGKMIGDVKDL